MKKILIIITIFIFGIFQGFSYLDEPTEGCQSGFSNFCTSTYIYGRNNKKIFIKGIDYKSMGDSDTIGYLIGIPPFKDINNITYKEEKDLENFLLEIPYLYEAKYNNHAFYYIKFSDYKFKNKNLSEKEKKEFEKKLYEKYKDKIGFYIDDKLVMDYIESEKYKTAKDFFVQNKIQVFNNKNKYIYGNENYRLSDKIIKRLNNFLNKLKTKKINKDKILKKIEKIEKKYENKNDKISTIVLEVLNYLHTEIFIEKLKESSN